MATDPEMTNAQMRSLARAALLTGPEENALARRAQQGDLAARNALVEANLRLAYVAAARMQNRGLPLADLIQEAVFGLIRAAERFDPDLGYRFATYASHWLRQALNKGLSDKGRAIRLPVNVATEMYRVRRLDRVLRAELGREPTLEEVARELEVPLERLTELLPRTREPRSLAESVGPDDDELGSLLASADGHPADELYARAEEAYLLRDLIQRLSPREQRILTLRYGLDGEEPQTLEEVGEEFHLTRERIRQIEIVAVGKLKDLLKNQELRRTVLLRSRGVSSPRAA